MDLKQGNRHLVGNSVEVKQTGEGKQVQRWAYLVVDLIIKTTKSIY